MIDLSKEIIFRDAITFTNRDEELTESFLSDVVYYLLELGMNFGLMSDEFEINDEMVYYEWRGSKRDVLRFYTYYSKNMTTESLEERKTTQKIILNK